MQEPAGSSDTSNRPPSKPIFKMVQEGHTGLYGLTVFLAAQTIRSENPSPVFEIEETPGTASSSLRYFRAHTGSTYVNAITRGFLIQSDVDTAPLGVLHAEEFAPKEFHDRGEQLPLLTTPSPVVEALEFLPEKLVSFSLSLVELLRSEARSFGVSMRAHEWSVFADPQDSCKELVLGVTVDASSDQALEFWDKVSEKISAKKQALSFPEQNLLNERLSVQIYWP